MPTREGRPLRRNRLDERVAVFVGIAAGAVAAGAGARPTGTDAVDVLLVGMVVAAVTWASASAPWWAVAAAAAVAAIVAIDPVLTLVGALAFVGGLWIGVRRRDLGAARCLLAAITLNVLVRAELDGRFGTSAVVGILTGAVLVVAGIRRRRRVARRAAWTVLAVVGAGITVALVGFAVAAGSARSRLVDGDREARAGIERLAAGDFGAAAARFESAAAAFGAAEDDLARPWARLASIVPGVAQNADAVRELAASATDSTSGLAAALERLDPDRLRVRDGRIDLDAIDAFAAPLATVQASLTELRATVADAGSPWLVAPLADRMRQLDRDIAANEQTLDNAVMATRLVPALLGGDGPRRYFVAFTTPAEARGLGGLMGNYAELVADAGQLTLTAFGRTGDLNSGGPDPTARHVAGPAEWIEQWGRYGLVDGRTGTTSAVPWSNVTMSPHFPSTAAVIAELYSQSGGRPVDGVFAMDPYVLAALLGLTGPVEVPATGATLAAADVVAFLLQEQYAIDDRAERIDLLEDVARQTVDRVLDGALPAPTELATVFGPLADQGRLVGWSAVPAEQELFDRIGLAGALPEPAGRDGVAVVVNNAAANKIDVYLRRRLQYRATVDPATGQVSGTLDVTLTNEAPAQGRPAVVIGNVIGEPAGTNRALVSIYTALPIESATLDGAPAAVETGRERGWVTSRLAVSVPPGGSRTISLQVQGSLDVDDGYVLLTRPQPLVLPEHHELVVTSTGGDELVVVDDVATAPRRIEAAGDG